MLRGTWSKSASGSPLATALVDGRASDPRQRLDGDLHVGCPLWMLSHGQAKGDQRRQRERCGLEQDVTHVSSLPMDRIGL